jgi:hypothetical protein
LSAGESAGCSIAAIITGKAQKFHQMVLGIYLRHYTVHLAVPTFYMVSTKAGLILFQKTVHLKLQEFLGFVLITWTRSRRSHGKSKKGKGGVP